MAACTAPAPALREARFRVEENQHHISSSEKQPFTTIMMGKLHLLHTEL